MCYISYNKWKTQYSKESEENFKKISSKSNFIYSLVESFNPPGIFGGLYFDNKKFVNNIVSDLSLKLNDFNIYGNDEIYDLKIIIKGSVKTYYHLDQYIGTLYLYIFPTK